MILGSFKNSVSDIVIQSAKDIVFYKAIRDSNRAWLKTRSFVWSYVRPPIRRFNIIILVSVMDSFKNEKLVVNGPVIRHTNYD